MSEHTLAILVKALGAAKAAKELKGVDSALSGIGARAGRGLRDAASNIQRLGVAAAGIGAAGLVASVKAAADFQSQLNTINTVAGLTESELGKVGAGIRSLARDTGASLGDLTGAYYDLVSAGIKPGADALKVLTLANTLAIGGLATTGETVDLLTTAINTYGLNAKQAAKATDQFAEAIALGKVTAAQIAETFSIVGPLAQAMGIGIDQISASYAQLTAKGIPAAEAMTDMRSALAGLAKPTASLNKAQKVLGVNFAKLAREKGLTVALAKIRAYSEKTGVPLAKLLGRIEAVQYTLSTTGNNADDYAAALKKVQAATGTAADQMAERQKGLNFQLGKLKALALDAGITIGSKLLPKLTPLAEKAVAFLNTHQSDIDAFGDKIAGAFDKALAFSQKIPWEQIGAGLETAASWAGKLMDVFLGLPPGVQTTLIALAGLNKLSGGAVTGIVGELGKGLIKGVLGMNAGVVNIKAGVVNGAGGGAAGAAGGATGKLGTVASALSKVFIVGAAVGAFAELAGIFSAQDAANHQQGKDLVGQAATFGNSSGAADIQKSLNGISTYTHDLWTGLTPEAIAYQLNIGGVRDSITATKDELNKSLVAAVTAESATTSAVEKVRAAVGFAGDQSTTSAEKTRSAVTGAGITTKVAIDRSTAAADAIKGAVGLTTNAAAHAGVIARSGGLAAAAAVRAKKSNFITNVHVTALTSISVRDTIKAHASASAYQRTLNQS